MEDKAQDLQNSELGNAAVSPEDLFRPINDPVFRGWMSVEYICAVFLESILRRPVGKIRVAFQKEVPELDILVRNIRVDILATNEHFEIYNIEGQKEYLRKTHRDRCLMQSSRLISLQLQKGQDFSELRPTTVIFINVQNPYGIDFVDSVSLRFDAPEHEVYNDKLRIIEFNLDRHSKAKEDDPKTLRVFSLFCMYGDKEELFKNACAAEDLEETELVQTLLDRLKEIRRDKDVIEDLNDYFKEHQYIEEVAPMPSLRRWEETIAETRAETRAETMIEGKIKGKIEDALGGFEIDLTVEAVAKQTKLPVEFVEMLSEAAGDVSVESAYAKYVEMYAVVE
jgi:predicted transposase/invertase (TIGR01784 family)